MIRTLAALALLAVLPSRAQAQTSFEGLDLTDDAQKKEQEKGKEGDIKGDESLSSSAAPPVEPKKPEPKVALPPTERDVTQEDRVKSVQKKLYMKRNRFELAPYGGFSVNDPFYTKYGFAVRGGFYLSDTLALSARFSMFWIAPTDDVKTAKRNFQSRIFFSVPMMSAMANVEWSPFYGKVAFLNSILHFDGYLLAGAGAVQTETSVTQGYHPAADLGVGARFVAKDFLAVNVALINTAYVDQPAGTTKGNTINLQMLYAGVSLFLPFKSTFREAE